MRRTAGRNARRFSWRQRLFVEHRPFGIGIVEHRPAAREAGTLIDRPGSGMAIAGLRPRAPKTFAPRQGLDLLDDQCADLAAAMRRPRIHALDLADALGVALQGAACHRLPVLAGDE